MDQKPIRNNTKTNFILDVIIFFGVLTALAPAFTGLELHEWVSLALAATSIVHILLHWDWVISVTKSFFGNTNHRSRVNYILNWMLFIGFSLVNFSGLMISRYVLDILGLSPSTNMFWKWLHFISADLIVTVLALHLALHWKWILNISKRYIFQPLKTFYLAKTEKPPLVSIHAKQD